MHDETSFGRIHVCQVLNDSQRKKFVEFPTHLYREDPRWTPPLGRDLQNFLNPERNPFFHNAEAGYFLAECDGHVLGRIAAIHNRAHNEFHRDAVGFFGLFECIDNPEVAGALLEIAGEWLAFRGLTALRGPMNFSMNDDFGCVIMDDASPSPARALQPYNPPYYARLFERAGLEPVKDCLAFGWEKNDRREVLYLEPTYEDLRIRPIRAARMSTLLQDLKGIHGVYQAAWNRNWGFLPTSDQELEFTARRLRSILDPNLMLVAESDGEIVGMMLAVPDYHVLLRQLRGRAYPWLLPRAIKALRAERTAVLIAFGIRPSFQGNGISEVLTQELLRRNAQYDRWETNWVLEDNHRIRHMITKRVGGKPIKRFRVFEGAI